MNNISITKIRQQPNKNAKYTQTDKVSYKVCANSPQGVLKSERWSDTISSIC